MEAYVNTARCPSIMITKTMLCSTNRVLHHQKSIIHKIHIEKLHTSQYNGIELEYEKGKTKFR